MAAEGAESSKRKISRDHPKQQHQHQPRHHHQQQYQHQQPFVTATVATSLITPTSPPYPPFTGTGGFRANGFEEHYPAYVYPISPQFPPVYADGSYPGSPVLHPQSPPMNPTSPPFSPTFHASPPIHAAYVLPHHFPPLHISSPVLTGTASVPGSSPLAYHLPVSPTFGPDYRHHHHNTAPRESYQYHTHNVYVRGLADTVTDESFQDMCKAYGHVVSSKAIIDQKTGLCKGYGFAMYEKEEECLYAIEELNKKGLQASFARVGQESFSSRLRSLQDETSTNIYISNLPLDMTEQKLEALFQPYQTVSNRILRDPQSQLSRGVGFARMADRPSALAIIEKFNGHTLSGSSAPLQVRFADSPAQKRLKSQTARKKLFKSTQDYQSMIAGFPTPGARPMPMTPETMLGFAPVHQPVYYQDHQGSQSHSEREHEQQPDDESKLAAQVEQNLNIKSGSNDNGVSHE